MTTMEPTPPPVTLNGDSAEWVANVLRGLANIMEMDGPNLLTDAQLGLVARAQGTPDAVFRADVAVKTRNLSQGLVDQLMKGKG